MYEIFTGHRIIPVVVLDDAGLAEPLAEALLAGGIGIIEITLRTPAAVAAITRLRRAVPAMTVGAGSVVTPEQCEAAAAAGARFAMAPGLDPATVTWHGQHGLPFVPGVATPSDIQAALRCGCHHLKFFPAGVLGGSAALQAVAAPYAGFGIRYCPTGGIGPGTLAAYLALPAVFAVGGTWLATADDLARRDWPAITRKAAEAAQIARSPGP